MLLPCTTGRWAPLWPGELRFWFRGSDPCTEKGQKMRTNCPLPVFFTWRDSLTLRRAYDLRGAFNFALVFCR